MKLSFARYKFGARGRFAQIRVSVQDTDERPSGIVTLDFVEVGVSFVLI